MLTEIRKLYETGILAPAGIYRLAASFFSSGINPMALLSYAAKCAPNAIAITDEYGAYSYAELQKQCTQLAVRLQKEYHITARQKVAIICRNHASLVRALFSVSCLGAHVYLLNVDMSQAQFAAIIKQQGFHVIVHDAELGAMIKACGYAGKCIEAYGDDTASIDTMCKAVRRHGMQRIRRARAGNIIVLTGGTTGQHKVATRKPGVMRFVSPFCALLVNAELGKYQSVYIATPIYHGYGLAALFVSVLLQSRIYLQHRFEVGAACALIRQNDIEVTTLVPVMLHRMMECDATSLQSLRCVITGGAAISPQLVKKTLDTLGPVLYNLYGTSEAGICIMATPADLAHAMDTVGKSITGVQLRIVDKNDTDVAAGVTGRIFIKNSWSVTNARNTWIDTGDMGYMDSKGYVFLCGRADDMIVSGGENVYPIVLEHALAQHPSIKEVAVIGIRDEEFGQRLRAFVVPEESNSIDTVDIRKWLQGRVARYEMPVEIIVLEHLPYTALGKPDKQKLRSYHKEIQ